MRSAKINAGDTGLATQYNNLRSDAYGASQLLVHQQATPGMTLYVEPGAYRIGANRYIFAGGNTPSFTAPSSNPRIDIVTIDTSGTVAITQGTEASSPTAPAYPLNKLVLAEIYNRVGETALYDADPGGSTGYVYNDVRPFLGGAYISSDSQIDASADISFSKLNTGAIDEDLVPDGDGTRNLGSGSYEWNNLYVKTALYVNGVPVSTDVLASFGDGSDGNVNVNSSSFSSGPITNNALTRDAYFSNLTLSGGNLNPNGYRIFVSGTLTIDSGYSIAANGGNGGNASGTTGGSAGSQAHTVGSVAASAPGQAGANAPTLNRNSGGGSSGTNGTTGTSGTSETNSLTAVSGASGGSGGNGGSAQGVGGGGGAGGAGGGSATAPTYGMHKLLDYLRFLEPSNLTLSSFSFYSGSAGAGGGGSGATGGASCGTNGSAGSSGGGGGGSGAAGGNIVVFAFALVNNGSITANGGNGGNGDVGGGGYYFNWYAGSAGGGGGGGGGAGGNGGLIFLVTHVSSGSGSTSVTGGTGGTGATYGTGAGGTGYSVGGNGTAGSNGSNGNSGLVVNITL